MDTATEPPVDGRHRRSRATREALIDLAAERFASQGYAQTSMRDLERDGPVTLAAIYSHFKNKADLLVAALNRRITLDLEERPDAGRPVEVVERLTDAAREFPERRQLRSLLVQAAAAAQTDDDTRARVAAAQREHVDAWIAGYHANRERLGIDPEVDIDTAVLYTWAVELGLGILESFDMAPESPEHWAEIQGRLALSLLTPAARRRKRRTARPAH